MAASANGAKLMLLAVFFFALAHASVKALNHIPFYELVVWRQFIVMCLCLAILYKKNINPLGNNRKGLFIRGLVGTIAIVCYFFSLQNMPLASAVTLQYLSPIATILISHFLFNEKMDKGIWAYFALAFVGVLLVKGFDTRITMFELGASMTAVFLAAYAYSMVRALRKTDHELVVVLFYPLVTLPIVTPFAVTTWVWPQGNDWWFIAAIGVFAFIAQFCMTKSYHLDRTQDVAIFNYVGVIFALFIGFFYFDESFHWLSYVGMALVLGAVSLSKLRRAKKL